MLAVRQHIFLRHIRERREMVIFNRFFVCGFFFLNFIFFLFYPAKPDWNFMDERKGTSLAQGLCPCQIIRAYCKQWRC